VPRKPRRRVVVLATLLALALLAGCAPARPRASSGSGDRTLVQYQRLGGIAGFDDRLTLDQDGRAVLTRGDRTAAFTVDAAALARLTGLLAQLALVTPGPVATAAPVFDQLSFVLSYHGRTFRDTDAPAFRMARDLLNQLIAAHTPA